MCSTWFIGLSLSQRYRRYQSMSTEPICKEFVKSLVGLKQNAFASQVFLWVLTRMYQVAQEDFFSWLKTNQKKPSDVGWFLNESMHLLQIPSHEGMHSLKNYPRGTHNLTQIFLKVVKSSTKLHFFWTKFLTGQILSDVWIKWKILWIKNFLFGLR